MSIYPPHTLLDPVLSNCCKAASVYVKCWRHKNEKNQLTFLKEEATNYHCIQWKTLKHDLRLLQKEGVLKFKLNSTNDKIDIHLHS